MLRSLALISFLVLVVLWLVPTAGATTYTVNRTGDPVPGACTPSHCTLREAVRAANLHAGADKIVLVSKGPYILQRPSTAEDGALDGDLDITNSPLQIVHTGKGRATIDAKKIDRIFEIFTGAPTTLIGLKITGGDNPSSADGNGGGIRTYANLRIVNSAVVGNIARGSDGSGGGIQAMDGRLTILKSSVSFNVADTSGAFDIANHGVVIEDSLFTGNRANFAGVSYMYGDGKSRIERTTMSKNHSTSETGTIYFSESAGSIQVLRSTISGNTAVTDGGGFSARNGTVLIVNTTITGNRAGGNGGGLWALTPTRLNSVTIVRNVANSDNFGGQLGGGVYVLDDTLPMQISNSLIALNTLGSGARSDCGGDPVASLGHNLISKGPAGGCNGFDKTGDLIRSNPKIGLLKKNGGPTKTIALLKGSPAINKAAASSPSRDQRGVKRGKKPDIGAFELYAR
jgi:CSLREA domain-containing protein